MRSSPTILTILLGSTLAAATAAQFLRHAPTTTATFHVSSVTVQPETVSVTTVPEPLDRLARRAPLLASGTTVQEPPRPSDWLDPDPSGTGHRPPSVTRTTASSSGGNGVRPTNDLGTGRAPPPRDMSPAKPSGEPDPHAMVLAPLEPEQPKQTGEPGSEPGDPGLVPPGGSNNRMASFSEPGFINIWLPNNVPQPGNPIVEDPPIPSPTSDRPPTTPTQTSPGGGGGSDGEAFTDLPPPPSEATATPTFTAIPIIPPILSSLNQTISNTTTPSMLDPPAEARCGDGWCTHSESCATCVKDCSISHFNVVGNRRYNRKRHSPLYDHLSPQANPYQPPYLTFNCAAPQFAQFCPPPPKNETVSNTRNAPHQSAMLAIVGSHPSAMTARLPELLHGVPSSAVAVFLDMQLLTSPSLDAPSMRRSINALRKAGYLLGIAIGSASFETPHALSVASILRAHRVYAHLPQWLARPESDLVTLNALLASSASPRTGQSVAPVLPDLPHDWPPLYLTTDPNSSFYDALTPVLAQLLFALRTRVVLPSLPLGDHLMAHTSVNAADTAASDVARILRLRPGIPGWIIGLDASAEASVPVVKRVVQEIGDRAVWVQGPDGVRACFEYRPGPTVAQPEEQRRTGSKTVAEVFELVRVRSSPAVKALQGAWEVGRDDAKAAMPGGDVILGDDDGC